MQTTDFDVQLLLVLFLVAAVQQRQVVGLIRFAFLEPSAVIASFFFCSICHEIHSFTVLLKRRIRITLEIQFHSDTSS